MPYPAKNVGPVWISRLRKILWGIRIDVSHLFGTSAKEGRRSAKRTMRQINVGQRSTCQADHSSDSGRNAEHRVSHSLSDLCADFHQGLNRLIDNVIRLVVEQRGKAPLLTAIMVCEQSIQRQRYEHLLLTPDMIARHGMNRITVYRALVDLERAGLVTVRRRRGEQSSGFDRSGSFGRGRLRSQVGLNTEEN